MENTENGMMGPSNAAWGNMNWGNTPPWWGYGRGGAGGVATAGLITGIIGSVLGLATGGFGLAQLASQYADQAAMLGVLDKTTGEVNLDAVEYVVTHGVTWPQQIGPFKVDKSDAEKVLAAVRIQDKALHQPQQKEAQ